MKKNIVILGAGFGGIRCALELALKVSPEWKVILVDRNSYHIYFPRLYELAIMQRAKSKEQRANCTIEIRDILKGTNIEFIQGEITRIDCKERKVGVTPSPDLAQTRSPSPTLTLPSPSGRGVGGEGRGEGEGIPFEYLVLALGAGTDYFGIDGLEKYACTLKSIEDAEMIREKVTNFLQKIRHPEEPQGDEGSRTNKSGILRAAQNDSNRIEIMIGGAGATGVEVAAELAYLFRNVPREKWSVTLVEALSTVLWMFPSEVSKYAYHRLTKLGVHVMLDTCIKKVEGGANNESAANLRISNSQIRKFGSHSQLAPIEVVFAPRPLKPGESEAALVCSFLPEHEKRISADLLLWAGGVRSTPLLSRCALPVDRKGRMEVDEYLRVKNFDNVFAIGDDATLINPKDQKLVPATAQAAIEQGRLVAENIVRLIKTGSSASVATEAELPDMTLRAYRFHEFPAIIPLGGHAGVAYVGGRVFTGLPTWFLRKAADCRYFASISGWWRAVKRYIMK